MSKADAYWQAQEERWYRQWEKSQKSMEVLEDTIRAITELALQNIDSKDICKAINQIAYNGIAKALRG